jgi:cytidylate kinase
MQSAGGADRPGAGIGEQPVVTISRQAGSGALVVGQKLADYLQLQDPDARCGWTVFDKNLVEKVLEDHHLPKRLAQFMPEDRGSEIEDIMAELVGLHPASWTLVHQTMDTILRLAHLGRVVLIGRGATLITRKLPHVFHVRLVGSLEKRIAHVQEQEHLEREAAANLVQERDAARARYLKKYFGQQIEDPLLYDLIINTDRITYDVAARMIGDAVMHWFPKVHATEH